MRFRKLLTASMPGARNIRVWRNFKEVTNITSTAELHIWPYVPIWGLLSMFVRDEAGRLVVDGYGIKEVHKYGLVWWMRKQGRLV